MKTGPRRLPGLAQRPAAGALLPRATRSKGGEGRAQKYPGRNKKEREKEKELSCWRNATGAVPELSLLSQMLAMSWPQWPAWGKPVPGGSWTCLLAWGGESCLAPPTSLFNEAARRQFRRRAMKATLAVHTGVAPGRLVFGVSFWG